MASSAVTALLLALAALAAVEAAVHRIAETASPTDMQKWLNSLGSECEELSSRLMAVAVGGKPSGEPNIDLPNKVTAQINKIKQVLDSLIRDTNACRGAVTCVKSIKNSYMPKINLMYNDQLSLILAVRKFVGN